MLHLFMKPNIGGDLVEMAAEAKSFKENLIQMYKTYKKICYTAKYWLTYLNLMMLQHQIHNVMQTNAFDKIRRLE